jgi:hypothetical protein
MTIHELMEDRIGLATIYAEDGAFHSAARVLRELASSIEQHASACDAALRELTGDPINLQGSGPAPIEPREE